MKNKWSDEKFKPLKKFLTSVIFKWDVNSRTVSLDYDGTGNDLECELDLAIFKSSYSDHWFREQIGQGEEYSLQVNIHNYNFPLPVVASEDVGGNFIFINCQFQGGFDVRETEFTGKLKARLCDFYVTNFFNTVFTDLADFYKCDFHYDIIFLKTDFLGTTVFSASTFWNKALFTYSLIDKELILRGTNFESGVDFSLSIGRKEINCFGLVVKDFVHDKVILMENEDYDNAYERCVTEDALIPIENKRETYRILKQTLVSQGNISESLFFKVREKETLRVELRKQRFIESDANKKWRWVKKSSFYIGICLDRVNLWLNKRSNYYGKSYGRAVVFVVLVGGLFFYLSCIFSPSFVPAWHFDWSTFCLGVSYFFQFLLPTHKFDYMGDVSSDVTAFYIFDFLGRLFVGYGIYQFIQAFRKYR